MSLRAIRTGSDTAVDQAGSEDTGDEHRRFVAALFEKHGKALLGYLEGLLGSRPEAEDVLQEAYLRLLEAPQLERNVVRARSYAFRVATNLAYERFRRNKMHALGPEEPAAREAEETSSPESMLSMEQCLDAIAETLTRLKPRSRRVMLLRVHKGLSYEAIAELLGISKRTVEREMSHAVAACQKKLKRFRI